MGHLMKEVPKLSLEEIQQRMVGVWIGNFYSSSGYVGKKLGRKSIREFHDVGARQVASTFKHMGFTKPIDVVMAVATNETNLFGSSITIEEEEDVCILRREHCALLAGARAFAKIGAALIAKEHCKICSDWHWRRVFSELGMELEFTQDEDGCTMRIQVSSED